MHVVATAGHVDHGKSTLVLALTGTDPDRFAEEKARGLTIDLGFAWTDAAVGRGRSRSSTCPATSASSRTCSPASARSTPACSSSPPPRAGSRRREEHLRILELLGVAARGGRADQGRPRRRRARSSSPASTLADHVAGTFLGGRRGRGGRRRRRVGRRRAARRPRPAAGERRPPPADRGRPRLWIDRVVRGQGSGHGRDRHAHRRHARGRRRGRRASPGASSGAGPRPPDAQPTASSGIEPGNRVAVNLTGVEHDDDRTRRRRRASRRVGDRRRCSTPTLPDARRRSTTTSRAAARTRSTSAPASTRCGCACSVVDAIAPGRRAACGSTCPSRCRCCPATATCCARAGGPRPSAAARCSTSRPVRPCARPVPTARSTGRRRAGIDVPADLER